MTQIQGNEEITVVSGNLSKNQSLESGEHTQIAALQTCPVCGAKSSAKEQFCIDCGFLLSETPGQAADLPEKKAVLVDSHGREYILHFGENNIGREAADILITDNTVSRKHAIIKLDNDGISIQDLGSTNGTEVDGYRIEPGVPISVKNESQLRFGSVKLILKAPEFVSETANDNDQEVVQDDKQEIAKAAPAAWLILPDGSEFELKEGINRIGRRENNDIRISSDGYVSGAHAEIECKEGRIYLTDIGSTNGTLVNGVKIEPNNPTEVSPEDEIVFGQTSVRIRTRGAETEDSVDE